MTWWDKGYYFGYAVKQIASSYASMQGIHFGDSEWDNRNEIDEQLTAQSLSRVEIEEWNS